MLRQTIQLVETYASTAFHESYDLSIM